ncbi:MAG: helicase-related protein [Cyanobium sp. LacPavin_0920_WC12_MAG_63_22]|nr:helicase-related protein [Cyanobium sp. LacPavin_0920_WC12_MAG_63_22]
MLLQAPPGAGKTTRVPLALLAGLNLEPGKPGAASGRIWMLEPRRLAAKAAAQRLAAELGEPLGQQVGYSVRLESCISAATRLEVLTDGLFLRRLQANPGLDRVDCLIFDEFHERGADTDLSLALVRQARELLKPELRLVLMSATLNLAPLAEQLPGATVLTSEGRCYPVAISHQPPRPGERLTQQVVRALEQHWLEPRGNGETVLIFLPGQREIQDCSRAVAATDWGKPSHQGVECVSLHGNLPLEAQSRAIGPASSAAGKVVLATSIAESSLTLAGVTLVIDSGLSRRNRFDPGSGLDGLVTVPASQASADQRAGRAGRLGPGRCLRLWSPAEQQRRPAFDPPELLEVDPLPLALQLAQWGDPLGRDLDWIDPPAPAPLKEARLQLEQLGALAASGRLNSHGQRLAQLGVHPRLAQLLLLGEQLGQLELACGLAVLLSERDPLNRQLELACGLAVLLSERDPLNRQEAGSDLLQRLDWLGENRPGDSSQRRLRQLQSQLQRQVRQLGGSSSIPPAAMPVGRSVTLSEAAAALVAAAYPERLALARAGKPGRYLLSGGRGAVLHADDPLVACTALAVAQLDGQDQDARIQLAIPIDIGQLRQLAEQPGGQGHVSVEARWDGEAQRVRCERSLRLGALVLERRSWSEAEPALIRSALLEGLRQLGLEALPWDPVSRQLQQRLSLAHQHLGDPWPDCSPQQLLDQLDEWLGPHLNGLRSRDDLQGLPLGEALWGDTPWSLRSQLDQLLPVALSVPSGRQVKLDYSSGQPVLAVKLQELFGARTNPMVLSGQLAVTVHLLTPAGRPAAITQDLEGFWVRSYPEVRKELRGRYPRHPWPEDPCQAQATALTKARLQQGSHRA